MLGFRLYANLFDKLRVIAEGDFSLRGSRRFGLLQAMEILPGRLVSTGEGLGLLIKRLGGLQVSLGFEDNAYHVVKGMIA